MSGSNYQVTLVFYCIQRIAAQRGLVVFQVETIPTLQPRDQLQTQLTNQPIHQTHRFISLRTVYLGAVATSKSRIHSLPPTKQYSQGGTISNPLTGLCLAVNSNVKQIQWQELKYSGYSCPEVWYLVDIGSVFQFVFSKRCPTTTQMSWSQPAMMECK